jgi:hypothetical protein
MPERANPMLGDQSIQHNTLFQLFFCPISIASLRKSRIAFSNAAANVQACYPA